MTILILILTKSLILILFCVCACTRWGRFKRRGGGRYKCEPLSQAIRTPRAAKSHRPLPHHHADRGSSSTIGESTSSARSSLFWNPHHQLLWNPIIMQIKTRHQPSGNPHHQQHHLHHGIPIICDMPLISMLLSHLLDNRHSWMEFS